MSSESEMKYVIVVPDGMADMPMEELGGKTPLADSHTPWMDRMASAGRVGLTRTVPKGMAPGSDVANLSIIGYSPSKIYTGRAPFEAASMGIDLAERDVAFRLNLVTLDANYTIMADHSGDHITNSEAAELVAALRPVAHSLGLSLYPGVSYRHLLVWRDGPEACVTHPPHDFPQQPLDRHLPAGEGADVLLRFIIKSWKILEEHPVNLHRIRSGKGPANSVWPWGQGRRPRMRTLKDRYGITGAVIAAVDLIKGIGKYAGLEPIEVPGATGYIDTNYEGKVSAALGALETGDLAFIHVEAPDEASHSGDLDLKKKAIEDFDAQVVGPLLEGLGAFPQWRVLLMPDHRTPLATRTHSSDPVPFLLLDSKEWNPVSEEIKVPFTEETATSSGTMIEDGSKMIEILLRK